MFIRSFAQFLTGLSACSLLIVGCATAPKPAASTQSDWKVLFDGTSTAAFRGFKRADFPTNCWMITNGTLTSFRGGKKPTDVLTKEKYQNFELECEWKISPGGNSGIIYRVSEDYDHSYMTGPEMQVLDDSKHHDGQNPKTSAGALYGLIAPEGKVLQPVGEWNKVRLVVNGTHVEHWLNGVKVVEYEWASPKVKKLIAGSKFHPWIRYMTEAEGYIAFQFHGDVASYRNIRIRRL